MNVPKISYVICLLVILFVQSISWSKVSISYDLIKYRGCIKQIPFIQIKDTSWTDQVFKVVEQMPRFPGCEDISDTYEAKKCADRMMFTYITENMKNRLSFKWHLRNDRVVVQFIVEKDGTLTNFKCVRSNCERSCDEAIAVVEGMNQMESRWISGKQRGENVRVLFTLPIRMFGDIYEYVEEMPRFPGCEYIIDPIKRKKCADVNLSDYIDQNLIVPMQAKTPGKVSLIFVVEENGSLSHIECLRDLCDGCCDIAVELFEDMNFMNKKWSPGKKDGKTVRVLYKMDVLFR